MNGHWQALVLAGGRGPDDPMAKAYGVSHKCLLLIAGVPMLQRVLDILGAEPAIGRIAVSIETPELLAGLRSNAVQAPTSTTAARSAIAAIDSGAVQLPLLLTTGDHPLLTPQMLRHFLSAAQRSKADLCVGLARAETILAAYPQSQRTFLAFGPDRVSGCNLFALKTPRALKALERWQYLEALRKKPWRLFSAFGPLALVRFVTGRMTLESAFAIASRKLGLQAEAILLPFAEAAIDVDKPADKELAELILSQRG